MEENLIVKCEVLEKKIKNLEAALNVYNEAFRDIISEIKVLSEMVEKTQRFSTETLLPAVVSNNAVFEINDPYKESSLFYPNIVDIEATVEKIINHKKSIARFGDGEFAIIFGYERHGFQQLDKRLQKRLLEVLQSDDENLLIGIANNYGNLDLYTETAANSIRLYMNWRTRREHSQILNPNKIYYDAYITRPYVMYADNKTDAPSKRFTHLKQIWKMRDVIMIEGSQTRLGVGNDLFDNCKSIRRILLPPTNSFSKYDEALEIARGQASQDILFLIATGPSAGVFAYDLTKDGYQAVDVGHIDIEYEWFLKGEGDRTIVANKYTNEIIGDEVAREDVNDPRYASQIIADLS